MMQGFEMSNLGYMNYFIGLEIQQAEGCILMSQRKYTKDLMKKYNIAPL